MQRRCTGRESGVLAALAGRWELVGAKEGQKMIRVWTSTMNIHRTRQRKARLVHPANPELGLKSPPMKSTSHAFHLPYLHAVPQPIVRPMVHSQRVYRSQRLHPSPRTRSTTWFLAITASPRRPTSPVQANDATSSLRQSSKEATHGLCIPASYLTSACRH